MADFVVFSPFKQNFPDTPFKIRDLLSGHTRLLLMTLKGELIFAREPYHSSKATLNSFQSTILRVKFLIMISKSSTKSQTKTCF